MFSADAGAACEIQQLAGVTTMEGNAESDVQVVGREGHRATLQIRRSETPYDEEPAKGGARRRRDERDGRGALSAGHSRYAVGASSVPEVSAVTEVMFEVVGRRVALSEPEARILGERLLGFQRDLYMKDVNDLAKPSGGGVD